MFRRHGPGTPRVRGGRCGSEAIAGERWLLVTAALAVLVLNPVSLYAATQDGGTAVPPQLDRELNAVREDLRKAFNAGDLDLLLSYCHPQVIATWPNGQVAVGHDGVRKVVEALIKSDQRPFESYQVDPTVENRVVLNDGQVVVSRGLFNDEYTLTQPRGQRVQLGSLWTASLIKVDGRWFITSFHLSANAFDNPVIALYLAGTRLISGALGAGVGVLVGVALGVWWTRRRRKLQSARGER